MDDALVGEIIVGDVFTTTTVDGSIHGSHHSMESAVAEFEGWLRWLSAREDSPAP